VKIRSNAAVVGRSRRVRGRGQAACLHRQGQRQLQGQRRFDAAVVCHAREYMPPWSSCCNKTYIYHKAEFLTHPPLRYLGFLYTLDTVKLLEKIIAYR
jgi:hypothetical protein